MERLYWVKTEQLKHHLSTGMAHFFKCVKYILRLLSPVRFWMVYLFYLMIFCYGLHIKGVNFWSPLFPLKLPFYHIDVGQPSILIAITIWVWMVYRFFKYHQQKKYGLAILYGVHLAAMLYFTDDVRMAGSMTHFLLLRS